MGRIWIDGKCYPIQVGAESALFASLEQSLASENGFLGVNDCARVRVAGLCPDREQGLRIRLEVG